MSSRRDRRRYYQLAARAGATCTGADGKGPVDAPCERPTRCATAFVNGGPTGFHETRTRSAGVVAPRLSVTIEQRDRVVGEMLSTWPPNLLFLFESSLYPGIFDFLLKKKKIK